MCRSAQFTAQAMLLSFMMLEGSSRDPMMRLENNDAVVLGGELSEALQMNCQMQ